MDSACIVHFTFVLVRYHDGRQISLLIGKRSEPPSDKLGGEIFIPPHALVHVGHYIIYIILYFIFLQ